MNERRSGRDRRQGERRDPRNVVNPPVRSYRRCPPFDRRRVRGERRTGQDWQNRVMDAVHAEGVIMRPWPGRKPT